MPLQHVHGLFPRIIGKGPNAKRLMELLLRLRSEVLTSENTNSTPSQLGMMPSSSIESLIIIDREVDFVTPLLTQLTYEGLVDEIFGITDNQAEIDISIIGQAPGAPANQPQSAKRKIQLDSSDNLYAQLRDTNFATGSQLLSKFAKRLQSEYESRHTAKSTSELRAFVSKLPAYQTEQASLKTQIALAEEIEKQTLQSATFGKVLEIQQNLIGGADGPSQYGAIDELISRAVPLSTVLRLLCLVSCLNGGLKPKDLDFFKQQILQAYGYQHLLTLSSLEKAGLLVSSRTSVSHAFQFLPRPGGSSNSSASASTTSATSAATPLSHTNYSLIRRPLRLIVEDIDEQSPQDIAYTYSLYAPLSIRLVQCIIQKPLVSSFSTGGSTSTSTSTSTSVINTKDLTSRSSNTSNTNNISSVSTGWSPFEDLLRNIRGGDGFTRVQKGEEAATKAKYMLHGSNSGGAAAATTPSGAGASGAGAGTGKTILIMFLGGITYTEIAALRFIAKQEEEEDENENDQEGQEAVMAGRGRNSGAKGGKGGRGKMKRKVVICTTGILGGREMMDAVIEKAGFSLVVVGEEP